MLSRKMLFLSSLTSMILILLAGCSHHAENITPGCSNQHVPPYSLESLSKRYHCEQLKESNGYKK